METEKLSELEAIAKEADIVAYCRSVYCVLAHDAVRLLHAQGYQARRLEAGLLEWRTAGNPVAVGAA